MVDYIVVPLSGAIIGYCTNWLAIKMLFRPYYEKRVFGIKVPFTPGLMPKERYKLNKKIGETVEGHILTKDILIKTLVSENSGDNIKGIIDENFELISKSNMSISDCCIKMFGTTKEKNKEVLESVLLKVVKSLKNECLIYDITEIISVKIIDSIKMFDISKHFNNALNYFQEVINEKGLSYLNSQQFTEFMQDKTKELYNKALENENNIGYYFAEETLGELKNTLKDSIPYLSEKLRNTLVDNSDLDNYLRELTCKVVEESVGKFAVMFVNKEKIYETIKKNIITFLEDEKSYDIIYDKIDMLLQKGLQFSVCELSKNITYETVDKVSSSVVQSIQQSGTDDFIKKVFEYFETYIEKQKDINLYLLIVKIEPKFALIVRDLVFNTINLFIKNEGKLFVENQCDYFSEIILECNINSLVAKLDNENEIKLKEFAYTTLNNLIEKGANYFLLRLNISEIIESQLNKFEIDEAEKMVFSIVKKELNAITSLGGLLGFVIGLLTLIIK